MLLGLLFAALAATYIFVSRANLSNALSHAEANLAIAAGIFDETTRQRIEYLAGSAAVMSGDYAIRQVLQQAVPDRATLGSVLQSYTQRVGAPVIALLDADGRLQASSHSAVEDENVGPFRQLIGQAAAADHPQASGFSYLDKTLHALVVVPLFAPAPNVIGWFGLAYPIDEAFAQRLKSASQVEVTFVSTEAGGRPRVLASTLSADSARVVAGIAAARMAEPQASKPPPGTAGAPRAETVELPGDRYVTLFKRQDILGKRDIMIVLQRALSAELAGARQLEGQILGISLVALVVAAIIAFWIARGVSRPVLQLAAHTRQVAAGDYTQRLELERSDELGVLAAAFNQMSVGLAERDRVRDLLDKNVSPEIAARLMRDGAALGGEEREVTILFADLRGFTTMSEKFPPQELLALLNRYLDRMSAEIERHGGVIDKFIGDAIMALFGAPVAQGDAAERAITAALGMERALAQLNAELVAEGKSPLGIGIGINSARVVAGNIGSHRRLNYSVIGDGVNVASRLQSETRKAEFRANIITSAATVAAIRAKQFTLRPLGAVQVKGRAEPVEIFAVEAAGGVAQDAAII